MVRYEAESNQVSEELYEINVSIYYQEEEVIHETVQVMADSFQEAETDAIEKIMRIENQ